ncbi:MAG: histidine phosphatase family protein [Clostridiales bacterium]|nr:histidine phosphatase family protein [Clostridiales bacterium]
MKIYLIRHGATKEGKSRLYCGSSDVPLCDDSIKPFLRDVDVLISSPMRRCLETAKIMFPGKKIRISPDLGEMDFGRFELHSYEELRDDKDYISWITDKTGDVLCPGGESKNSFTKRVLDAFIREIDSLGQLGSAAFLLHGGVIGVIMESFCEVKKPYYEWKPPYAGGFETVLLDNMVLSFQGCL